jgi:hypothetical protein
MTERSYMDSDRVEPTHDDQIHDDQIHDDRMDDDRMDDDRTRDGGHDAALFDGQDARLFRERWQQVQSRFVDDPRGAVADADALVSDVTQTLSSRFAEQKTTLEQHWSQGDDVQTEDLRQTIQRYRTLFERLLAA